MTTKKETTTNPRRAKALRQARERMDDLATRLAQELGIETLEPRNLDRYDFHEVGVAGLKRVLQRAFVLGMQIGENEHPNVQHYIDAL